MGSVQRPLKAQVSFKILADKSTAIVDKNPTFHSTINRVYSITSLEPKYTNSFLKYIFCSCTSDAVDTVQIIAAWKFLATVSHAIPRSIDDSSVDNKRDPRIVGHSLTSTVSCTHAAERLAEARVYIRVYANWNELTEILPWALVSGQHWMRGCSRCVQLDKGYGHAERVELFGLLLRRPAVVRISRSRLGQKFLFE